MSKERINDQIYFIDNKDKKLKEINTGVDLVLEAASLLVEEKAIALVPVDTGRLKGSIGHKVRHGEAFVGSNVDYAPHVEFGTVKQRAQPFLGPAVDYSKNEVNKIFKNYLGTDDLEKI